MNKLRKKYLAVLFNLLIIFVFSGVSQAEQYFYFDAEEMDVGDILPLYRGAPANFCQTECSGLGAKGTIQSSDGVPQGNKYFQWVTVDQQHDCFTVIESDAIPDSNGWPITLTMGQTYYMASYMRFDRINGQDIWYDGASVQSADKGFEVVGHGLRLLASIGQWEHMAGNQDHHYTVWLGVMSCENPETTWGHNRNGYIPSNPIQLEYERWYSVILEFNLSCTKMGSIALWINGVKVEEHNNINTVDSSCSTVVGGLRLGGTIAQPAYDAPAHKRKFDALMLTDNWQDIVNGGYLSDSPDPPQDLPGSPPDFSANGN